MINRFKIFKKSHPDPKTMSPLEAMRYARDVIKNKWPEAEPIIMQDPEAIYLYAMDVLKDRWPEAEPIIMNDWIYASLYNSNVINKRPQDKNIKFDFNAPLEEGKKKKKKGLWDNIHAKRARGEKPAKKGDADFPDPKSWKKAQGKKEGKISPKKKMEESKLVESISNFLRDDSHLGFAGKKDYKERFSLSQRMMEDMYEELALKFVDSPFYESVTRAFRKIHSYKYVSNPTFKLSLISELRSTAVPEEVIEETCKAIDELSKKAEKDANWNMDQLYKIVDMTRNANSRTIKHEDEYNTPLTESNGAPASFKKPALDLPSIDEVVRSYRGGMSVDAIARKFQVSPKTIQILLNKGGLDFSKVGATQADTRAPALDLPSTDEVVRSYRGGMSVDAIARKFQVSPKTIQILLNKGLK